MKISEAKEGIEHTFPEEDGDQVKCPVCRKVWNTGLEGDVTQEECEHLRFFYFDGEFVEFYGNWNKKEFQAE